MIQDSDPQEPHDKPEPQRRDGGLIIAWMADMRLVSGEHQRAVRAGRAMQCLAQGVCRRELCYKHSFQTQKGIKDFWSHSWRTPAWKKMVLLSFWYNVSAANVAGTLGALVFFVLGCFDLTHSYDKVPAPWIRPLRLGCWCSLTGVLLFCLTLVFWKSPRTVWLDYVCIHQSDAQLRQRGLLSLGANIKNTKTMLVLWDETWVERLWCIFEMAAFLKSHGEEAKSHLVILPTFLCPFWLVHLTILSVVILLMVALPFSPLLFAGLGFAAAVVTEMLIFDFYSKLDVLDARLRQFSLTNATCTCCSTGHTDREGKVIHCDRKIIIQCLCQWFGSEAASEANISSTVADSLRDKLSRFPFQYWMFLSLTVPLVWAFMDQLAARIRDEAWEEAGALCFDILSRFFNVLPAVFAFTVTMVHAVQRVRCSRKAPLRWLCRAAVALLHLLPPLGSQLCNTLLENRLQSEALFFALTIIPALAAWRLCGRSSP